MLKKLSLLFAVLAVAILAVVTLPKTSAAGNNLIANSSVETAAGALPASWSTNKTGTNATAFNYLNTGHTGNRSLQVQMTSRNSGQAEWVFAPVTVAPSTKYTFSDWYQSNVQSTYAVIVTKTNGTSSTLTTQNNPASTAWKQASLSFTTPSRASTVTIYHYINRVGQLTSDDYDLEGPSAPAVNLTSPTVGTTVSGSQTVGANATDTIGIKNVQFKLDGVNLGAADTTAPYSVAWNTANSSNGNHTLTAVATNTSNLSTTSADAVVNVNNVAPPTPPTVSFSAPASGGTVSGNAQAVSANATDKVGVLGVQFKLDNVNLGNEITTAPFTVNWDTTTAANGSHSLTATARNAANLTTVVSETVTVNNVVTPPPAGNNLLANPSLETSANGTAPDSWLSSNWGTNTSTFGYLNTGHTGTHSVKVQTTAFTNGAANWYYADVPVTAGKSYRYENWYQSNVDTEVDAEVVMSDNSIQYYWLGTVPANTNWTKFAATFTVPAGAKSLAIYQILAKVGYIVSDDYSLSEYTPLPLNRGIVSVTFDDGWANQYANAFPMLKNYGIPATFYIISGELDDQPDYMTAGQVTSLQAAGNEIGSHSVTHPDLTTLSAAQVQTEMAQSQATLQALLGVPVTDFAYPYGAYNASTIATGKLYYQSQRTVIGGLNTKDTFDINALKIFEVDSNISQAQVQGMVQAAIAQKSWLILVYHETAVTPSDPSDSLYTTQPSDLNSELSYIKSSGVATLTVRQAINEILPQL